MEATIFKPRLKFKPPLKFFKFGHCFPTPAPNLYTYIHLKEYRKPQIFKNIHTLSSNKLCLKYLRFKIKGFEKLSLWQNSATLHKMLKRHKASLFCDVWSIFDYLLNLHWWRAEFGSIRMLWVYLTTGKDNGVSGNPGGKTRTKFTKIWTGLGKMREWGWIK